MIKPLCPICGKELEGGYQKLIYTEIDASDFSDERKEELKKKAEQVSYWIHDPKNIHRDIEVFAHKDCAEKIKKVYPDFDKPTQSDYSDVKYPTINEKTQAIELKTKEDFIKLKEAKK